MGRSCRKSIQRRRLLTDSLSRVCRFFTGARHRVVVVSAFVGAEALDKLLKSVPKEVKEVAVFARWDTDDIASGATDWKAWDVASRHEVPFYACPGLHAKIYIADEKALVGSANTTNRGLGLRGQSNLELLIPADAAQEDVAGVLADVEERSSIAAPIGADAAECLNARSTFPFWLPQVSPELFMDALKGHIAHTKDTRTASDALELQEGESSVGRIRLALRQKTTFRFVRQVFDERLLPMKEDELRELLAERIDSRFADLSNESIALLVWWLGRFGENTHLAPGTEGGELVLRPGGILSSFQER